MNTFDRNRGFTLIELLSVVLIIGICVGLASAIVRPNDQDALRVEAERLGKLLELAMEESSVSGKSIAWTADQSAYRFWRLSNDNEWREMSNNEWVRARTLPKGMTITGLQIENATTPGPGTHRAMRLEFSPYSSPPAFTISMTFGSARHKISSSPIGELLVLPDE